MYAVCSSKSFCKARIIILSEQRKLADLCHTSWVMLITEIGCSSSKIGLFVAVVVLSGMLHKRHEITNAVELLHAVFVQSQDIKFSFYYNITQITHLRNT